MKKLQISQTLSECGFSLIELMIVLAVMGILSAVAITKIYTGTPSNAMGAEGLLENAAERIIERRADAVRLSGEDRRSNLQHFTPAPLPIDFADEASTASLIIDGTDDDNDCVDDVTHKPLTCLEIGADNKANWLMSYNDDPLQVPEGWFVASSFRELGGSIPLIADGTNGRGVVATSIGFDETGKAFAQEHAGQDWQAYPTGSIRSDLPSSDNTPFWAVYFFRAEHRQIGKGNGVKVTDAVAIAVHPSGLIEKFRYDGQQWVGFKNRSIE